MKKSNKFLVAIILAVIIFNFGFILFIFFLPLKGNGIYTVENRPLNSFSNLVVGGAYSVRVVEGKKNSVSIRAESNLIKYITTEIRGDSLFVKYDRSIAATKKVEITVTANGLKSLKLESPSSVLLDNVNYKNFDISVLLEDSMGTPYLKATGQIKHLKLISSSFSKVDLKDLKCKTADIHMYGNSTVMTDADTVNAFINGKCKLIYYGNSKVINPQVVNGGRVIKYGSVDHDFKKPKHTLWVSYYHFVNKIFHFFSVF
ncbi:MAG TPA: DUF2807 domain-containing protein [Victivallales bacterium]|nr:DUF2807 domain-containing protein [Victivallales bacterium]